MEDAHEAHPNIADGVSFYFVCDGHSGRGIADLSAKLLPQAIRESDPKRLHSAPASLLTDIFVKCDRDMFKMTARNRGREGGATCVAACSIGNDLYLANLGDSRAVLSEAGKAIQLTKDHKPTDPQEAQRVRDMGGCIAFGRVGGCLAITRAFGDYELKGGDRVLQEGAPIPVSNVPEISHIQLSATAEFLILGCDGIWDVLSSQEAVTKCREFIAKGPQKMAQELVKYSLDRGTTDNVSALIVVFSERRDDAQQANGTRNGAQPYANNGYQQPGHAATARAQRTYGGPGPAPVSPGNGPFHAATARKRPH